MKILFPIVKSAVFIVVLLIFTSCATLPPEAPDNQISGDYSYVKEYMTWFIHEEMQNRNIVGLSIALVDDQQIVWQQNFGYADKENKINTTSETCYRAGSISKLFTGMAAMKLVDAGKMNIDQPLVTYLPSFKIKSRFGHTDGITPKTIMTHHSGLPSNWIAGMWTKDPEPFTQLESEINNEYVATSPGTVMSYSNLGVTLLGHAIQNVSGQVYSEFISERLLKPMGMNNSFFATDLTGEKAARSYDHRGEKVFEYPLRGIPAGGLNTTIVDLSRLAMTVVNHGKLQNNQIISKSSLDGMFTVQNNDVQLDLGSKIGLSWFINDKLLSGKEFVYGHSGAVIAHRASFMVAPGSKIGVVVLANTSSAPTYKIAGKLLQLAWEAKSGEKLPEIPIVREINHSDLTDENIVIEGTYSTLLGKVDIIKKSGNLYKAKLASKQYDLQLQKDKQYHLTYRWLGLFSISFDELDKIGFTIKTFSGHQVIIGQENQNYFIAGVKVEPYPINATWKKRLGRYRILNQLEPERFQIKDIELRMENDFLLLVKNRFYGDPDSKIIRLINNKEAIVEGFGRGLGETLRMVQDAEHGELLTFSGLRFKYDESP